MKNDRAVKVHKVYKTLSLAFLLMLNTGCDIEFANGNSNDTVPLTEQNVSKRHMVKVLKKRQANNQKPDMAELAKYNEIVLQDNNQTAGFWNEVVCVNEEGIVIKDCFTGEERVLRTSFDHTVFIYKWADGHELAPVTRGAVRPGDIMQIEIHAANWHSAQEMYQQNKIIAVGDNVKLRVFDIRQFTDRDLQQYVTYNSYYDNQR